MKKLTFLFFSSLLIFILAACGGDKETTGENNSGTEQTEQKTDQVNEGSAGKDGKEEQKGKTDEEKEEQSTVDITIPAEMFESDEVDPDTIMEDMKAQGVTKVVENSDGSLTIKMSKEKHEQIMKDMRAEIRNTIDEIKASQDYPSIKNITFNESFSEFNLMVNKEAYEDSFDGFVSITFGLSGMLYQFYDGKDMDDIQVTINVMDDSNGDLIETFAYPNDEE